MFPTSQRIALIHTCLLALAAQLEISTTAVAQSTRSAGGETPALMDRQKETALALSACPPMVVSKAAVYVLDKSGYVKIRESQNGFTALVQHSMITSQEPQCIDAEGTRTFLPRPCNHSRRISHFLQLRGGMHLRLNSKLMQQLARPNPRCTRRYLRDQRRRPHFAILIPLRMTEHDRTVGAPRPDFGTWGCSLIPVP